MNTIKVSEEELREIANCTNERYFNEFIFNEYTLILRLDGIKNRMIITRVEDEEIHVKHRLFRNGNYIDHEFSFIQDEKTLVCLNGGDDVIGIYDINKDGAMPIKEVDDVTKRWMTSIAYLIRLFEQYVMNKSYERSIVERVSNSVSKKTIADKKHGNNKLTTNYLLNDIIRYVSSSRRSNVISCECWTVRGHFRRYKSGKVVWIAGFTKGKNRNAKPKNKQYSL